MSEPAAVDAAAAAGDTAADTSAPAEGGGVEGSAPTTSAGAPAEQTEATSILDTELPEGMQKFDRSYVERLRAEAAERRVEARELTEKLTATQDRFKAFENYDDADMQVWTNLAEQWQTDPTSAAGTMRTIATQVLGDPTSTTEEKAEAVEQLQAAEHAEQTGDTRPVEEIVKAELERRDAQHAQDQAVQQIVDAVTGAGYPKGSPEYAQVLWFAANDPEVGGDVTKALDKFKSYEQSVIDRYVQSVASGKTPPVTTGGTDGQSAVPRTEAPKTMKEASVRARAFLDGQ